MRKKIFVAVLAAVAMCATVAACQDESVPGATGTSQTGTVTARTPSGSAQPGASGGGDAQPGPVNGGGQQSGTTPAPGPGGVNPAGQPPGNPVTSAGDRCVDADSAAVRDAIASLGEPYPGESYVVQRTTDAAVGSCPALLWALAATPRGTASSPFHVLFFDHDGYLGTATQRATAYTSVIGSADRDVQVRYKWLRAGEANCCPSGEAVITFTLGADGRTVTPNPAIPGEVSNPSAPSSGTCPVDKATLRQALSGSAFEDRLEPPVELADEIPCYGGWAFATSGGGERQRTQILFQHSGGAWQAVDIGSALRARDTCLDRGMPAAMADQLCF